MADLSWSESDQVDTLVGALVGTAGLIRRRPARADAARAAVLAGLGEAEKQLLRDLAADLDTPTAHTTTNREEDK